MSITLDILRRGPFAAGHAFGDTGAYERIDVGPTSQLTTLHPPTAR